MTVPFILIIASGGIYAQIETGSIEGSLLMSGGDDTPHVNVVVQLVVPNAVAGRAPQVVDTVRTNKAGRFRFSDVNQGQYRIRFQAGRKFIYSQDPLTVRAGDSLKDITLYHPPFKKGVWKNFTFFEELFHIGISAIYQDQDGILWFGTSSGVSYYDGAKIINFTVKDGLAEGRISSIAEEPNGDLWFAIAEGGVSRYNGETFLTYTTAHGLADNWVNCISRAPDGTLWFGTAGGVSIHKDGGFTDFPIGEETDEFVSAIHHAPGQMIWFGTRVNGVFRYDGQKFTPFTAEKDGLAKGEVNSIHRTANGQVWFATWGGVSRYDGETFTTFTTKEGLASNRVGEIYEDARGVLWFATLGGVSRYDGKTPDAEDIFVNFTTEEGLASNEVEAVYSSSDGILWFGTRDGVSRYDERGFVSFDSRDGLPNRPIFAIDNHSDGSRWFGTAGGVCRYDGETFKTFTKEEDGLASNHINSVRCASDGSVWVGTSATYDVPAAGVSRYDGKTFTTFTTAHGLAANQVNAIYEDSQGILWFGTGGGLSRYNGETFDTFTTENGLVDNEVTSIHEMEPNALWIGTKKGVSRYDGNEFRNFTAVDQWVTAIHGNSETAIWLGTANGLLRYDGTNFTTVDLQHQIKDAPVRCMYQDQRGIIWLGVDGKRGLYGYNGQVWTLMDSWDGLAGNEVWSIHQDADGFIWVGTEQGVTRYYPSDDDRPILRVSAVRAKDIYTDIDAIPPIPVGTRITVEYRTIDFKTRSDRQQYLNQLSTPDGLPNPLPEVDNTPRYEFTPATPGRYTLEVNAIDRDLNASVKETLSFTIIALPWYSERRNVTVVLATVILAGLIALFVGFHNRRVAYHRTQELKMEVELNEEQRRREEEQRLREEERRREEEERRREEEQRRREVLQVRNTITRTVIHDLKTPVTSAQTFLWRLIEELRKIPSVAPETSDLARKVQSQVQRVSALAQRMRRLERPVKLKRENINELTRRAVDEYAVGENCTVTFDPCHPGPSALVNADDIAVALTELMKNAWYAMANNGDLTVTTRYSTPAEYPQLNGAPDKPYVLLSLTDTGTGVPEGVRDTLFQAGSTTSGGEGLGLYSVRLISHEHGGDAWLERTGPLGSTFIFALPLITGSSGGS